MSEKIKKLEDLHELLAKTLLDKIRDPEVKSSDLNVARQFLKDNNIEQRGSNINQERLRFDFTYPRKLEQAELNKNRLKILKPDKFKDNKITFIKNNFYNKLDIEPVNIIILSNSIHFAKLNTINNVLDNLLNYLVKDGLIIIKEPWLNAIFGMSTLNQENEFRKEKIEKIEKIRAEIDTFIENSSNIKLIKSKDYKNEEYFIIIIKKI